MPTLSLRAAVPWAQGHLMHLTRVATVLPESSPLPMADQDWIWHQSSSLHLQFCSQEQQQTRNGQRTGKWDFLRGGGGCLFQVLQTGDSFSRLWQEPITAVIGTAFTIVPTWIWPKCLLLSCFYTKKAWSDLSGDWMASGLGKPSPSEVAAEMLGHLNPPFIFVCWLWAGLGKRGKERELMTSTVLRKTNLYTPHRSNFHQQKPYYVLRWSQKETDEPQVTQPYFLLCS